MIALCGEHHDQADVETFTVDQLRALKEDGRNRGEQIRGRFNWMRQQILAVVGGNFYFEVPTIIQVGEQPVVWWSRDDDEYLLLNVRMLTASGEARAIIEDNDWITEGMEADIECPPSGRLLQIDYPNGDRLKVEFRQIECEADLESRYRTQSPATRAAMNAMPVPHSLDISFPLTAVEVGMNVADTPIKFAPRRTEIGGSVYSGNWAMGGQVGMKIG